jgi:hypothetical protein
VNCIVHEQPCLKLAAECSLFVHSVKKRNWSQRWPRVVLRVSKGLVNQKEEIRLRHLGFDGSGFDDSDGRRIDPAQVTRANDFTVLNAFSPNFCRPSTCDRGALLGVEKHGNVDQDHERLQAQIALAACALLAMTADKQPIAPCASNLDEGRKQERAKGTFRMAKPNVSHWRS